MKNVSLYAVASQMVINLRNADTSCIQQRQLNPLFSLLASEEQINPYNTEKKTNIIPHCAGNWQLTTIDFKNVYFSNTRSLNKFHLPLHNRTLEYF